MVAGVPWAGLAAGSPWAGLAAGVPWAGMSVHVAATPFAVSVGVVPCGICAVLLLACGRAWRITLHDQYAGGGVVLRDRARENQP